MKKFLSFFVCVCLFLTGCGAEEEAVRITDEETDSETVNTLKPGSENGAAWTVLVYLCGTDLETEDGLASINVEEMMDAAESGAVTVVVQMGGAQSWTIEGVNPDELSRFRVTPGEIQLVDSQPLASMGAADTLGDFLRWGVESYPADHYMCILWNHGGGSVSGIAFDQLFDMDSLELPELADAVSQAGVEFEVIGFDACLMSTLETAAVLTPYARYMVASQEVEPGTGWDYTAILDALVENPEQTGLELGKTICDSFYDKCTITGEESLVTLSVTDLSKIPQLVQSFDCMAAQMKGFTAFPEKLQSLTQAMFRAENYGGNNVNEGYTNMADLGDMTYLAEGVLPETGAQLLDSLSGAVPYAVEGSNRQRSHGLSVYVPLYMTPEELDLYSLVATSGEYLRFFEGLYDWKVPDGTVISQPVLPDNQLPEDIAVTTVEVDSLTVAQALGREDSGVVLSTEITDDGYVTLSIDEGVQLVKSVVYNLFYLDEESNSLLFLGSDYDLNSDGQGLHYWDNFRNLWPVINGNTCSMLPLEWGEDYVLYTVPILLNAKETNLRVSYNYVSADYEVIGTWDGINSETGMSSREIRKLKDGDEVEFLFGAASMETGEAYQFAFGGFTVDGPVIVEEAELFEADFYYQYEVTDLFGQVYTSDFAIIKSHNGELTVEMGQ